MGKFFKLLIWLVGLIVLLVVAAIVLVPMFFDPNDYKEQISAKVKDVTGRDLTLSGSIGLSVFPWLGVELGGVKLSNAPGFGDEPFAVIDAAQVRAKLIPLLSMKVEVDEVVLKGLNLNLSKAKDGRTNWADLAGEGAAKPDAPEEPSSGPALAALNVGGINIQKARFVWDDQSTGQKLTLDGLDVKTGEIVPGKPVALDLGFNVNTAAPKMTARVKLDGTLSMDEAMQKLTVSPLHLIVADLSMEDGMKGSVDLNAKVDADLASQQFKLSGLKTVADLQGGAIPGKSLKAELAADVALDLAKDVLKVAGLTLQAGDMKVSGEINGQKLMSDPALNGNLAVAEFSPRKLMGEMGMELPATADAAVLGRMALKTSLQGGTNAMALNNLAITLDDTQINGGVKVSNFAKPAIGFDLKVDAIDLDRYLPPPAPGGAASAPVADNGAASGDLFPVDTIRGLNLDGVLHVGKLIINKLKAENAEVKVKAKDGDLRINHQISKFYEGSVNGAIGVDVRGATPKLSIEKHISKIKAGPLVKDLMQQDRFDGVGGFNANITASGQSVDAIKKSLNGNMDFSFTNGAVKGFNVAQIIREAKAKFSGKPAPASNEPNQTDFSELGGSATVINGVLDNPDLLAKSPFLRFQGKGKVNLGNETLDYVATPTIVSSLEGQGGAGLEELKGVPIPIKLKGALTKPDWSIDWGGVLTASQKAKLDEKKAELKAKADEKKEELKQEAEQKIDEKKDELKQKLEGKLKGLFR